MSIRGLRQWAFDWFGMVGKFPTSDRMYRSRLNCNAQCSIAGLKGWCTSARVYTAARCRERNREKKERRWWYQCLVMGHLGQAINVVHRTFCQPVNISPYARFVRSKQSLFQRSFGDSSRVFTSNWVCYPGENPIEYFIWFWFCFVCFFKKRR